MVVFHHHKRHEEKKRGLSFRNVEGAGLLWNRKDPPGMVAEGSRWCLAPLAHCEGCTFFQAADALPVIAGEDDCLTSTSKCGLYTCVKLAAKCQFHCTLPIFFMTFNKCGVKKHARLDASLAAIAMLYLKSDPLIKHGAPALTLAMTVCARKTAADPIQTQEDGSPSNRSFRSRVSPSLEWPLCHPKKCQRRF